MPYGSEQMGYTKARIGNIGTMFSARYSSLFRERRRTKGIRGMEGGTGKIKAQKTNKTA